MSTPDHLRVHPDPLEQDQRALAEALRRPPVEQRGGWFGPLSTPEKIAQGMFLGLGLLDWYQTRKFRSMGVEELNPVLGRTPSRAKVNTLIPLGLAAHTLGVWALPRPYRNILQGLGLAGEANATWTNDQRGYSPWGSL